MLPAVTAGEVKHAAVRGWAAASRGWPALLGGDSTPEPADTGPDLRAAFVRLLWARAVPADSTPGRHYLARRLAWPPAGIGPELPATVRWLAREAAPGHDPAAKWYGLPDGAAGALVFAWRRPGDADPEACGLRVRPGPVVFVSYEDSGARIAHRLSALYGPDLDPARIPHWPDPGPLYVGFEGGRGQGPGADWAPLWAAVRAMTPAPSMVVIDPASAALADVSMNEGGPVRAFMGALAREATAAGCGVLVVAHSTKADREANGAGPGAVAGAATWFDAARGVLRLSWKATKQEGRGTDRRRELRCIKANYGRSGWTVPLCEKPGRSGFGERSSVHRERRPERPGRMAGYPTTFGRRRVPTTFV